MTMSPWRTLDWAERRALKRRTSRALGRHLLGWNKGGDTYQGPPAKPDTQEKKEERCDNS